MKKQHLVLTYDLGTTGSKTCLYAIGDKLERLDAVTAQYPLILTRDQGAEQRVEDWWNALCRSTRHLMNRTGTMAADICGISFCCQMQGLVLVDDAGQAVRNPMIYLDARANDQIRRYLHHGFFRISGMNAVKLVNTLRITGGVAATPKDPLWKYHWVRENEPDNFSRTYKWLDVKDYLILKCTGEFTMTRDSAHITFIYDTRPEKHGWHKGLCNTFQVDTSHLPRVVKSTDLIGGLTKASARELGLVPGIPVFGGGGDVTLTSVGSGCFNLYDTHIYVGTSGWVVSNVNRRLVDINNFMASILGAMDGYYNYVGEQETSGACLQWARDHLACDGINFYPDGNDTGKPSQAPDSLYERLNTVVKETRPGAGNLIFTPWLHGNRTPREDAHARGMFFNIGMNTGKPQMIRAVMEGVAFHKRWILEAMEKKIPFQDCIRFVGGGAKSTAWCQIMADVTGRRIATIKYPQDTGTAGAAIVCAVGLGLMSSFKDAAGLIPYEKVYSPAEEIQAVYDTLYNIFKSLYQKNKKLFKTLNS